MSELETVEKTCGKCGESKPVSEFYRRGGKRNGFQPRCKSCNKEYAAAWYAENTKRVLACCAKYRANNKDKIKERNAKYSAANREKIIAYEAKWRAENKDRVRAVKAAYRAANPDKAREYVSKWHAAHPEYSRLKNHNRRATSGKLSKGLAARLFKLQRGKCACGCKQPLGDDYHLDHIMPLALGGTNTDDNIQLLRAICNQQKHAKHPIEFMQQKGFLL